MKSRRVRRHCSWNWATACGVRSLLETPGTEAEEEPSEVTAVPALERDWRTLEAENEEEEPEDSGAKPSWRRQAGSEETEDEAAASDAGRRSADLTKAVGPGKRHSLLDAHAREIRFGRGRRTTDHVYGGISDFRNIPAAPFSGEAWAAAIEAGVQNKTAVAEEEHPTPHAAELEAMVGHAEESVSPPQEESFVSESARTSEPRPWKNRQWFPLWPPSLNPSPRLHRNLRLSLKKSKHHAFMVFDTAQSLDAEAQKATRLASTWDALVTPAPTPAPAAAISEVTSSYCHLGRSR